MGMFGSQAGNIMFPTWEYVVPLMGMFFENDTGCQHLTYHLT